MNTLARSVSTDLKRQETTIAIIVLVVYFVGIAGITIPFSSGLFIKLIPFVLVLSLAACLLFHREYNFRTVTVFTMIIVVSYIIEASGVATGVIFGKYSYGPALGVQIFSTPVIIGLNWLLLIYGSACLVAKGNFHPLIEIVSASALMVFYDLALEAVAPYLGMWRFEGGHAPVQNYIAWFLVASLFHGFVKISGIRTSNRVAAMVFVVQFIFFLALAVIFHVVR